MRGEWKAMPKRNVSKSAKKAAPAAKRMMKRGGAPKKRGVPTQRNMGKGKY